MPNVARRWLVDSIGSRLVPAFGERAFKTVPIPDDGDRESKLAFPFGWLRRTSPNGFDQVEIQLATGTTPAFFVNFGCVPAAGTPDLWGDLIPPEKVWVHWLQRAHRLYDRPRALRPFAVRRWFWQPSPTPPDYEELVEDVVRLIPEVEDGLAGVRIGPHVRLTEAKWPLLKKSR